MKSMEINLSPGRLRALQLVQTDMLIEVDRVCRENGIEYSLAGGTLLGAIRHKGYIPWDDDADVVMMRAEYIKLAKIFNDVTNRDKYYFQDADNTPGYRWGYGKIRRKGTLWVRAGQEDMPFDQEICIDVFPLDFVPNGNIRGKLHNFHCFLIRKAQWSEIGKHTAKNRFARYTYKLLSKIPLEKITKHYHKLADKHNNNKNERLRVLTFPTPRGFDYEGEKAWYREFTEHIFEGHIFKIMSKYDDYLRLKYGDYMKLPPESEHVTHPASQFELPIDE